jgi:hypothetical protein
MQLAAVAAPTPHRWSMPPVAGRGVTQDMYGLPDGTLWARNRRSDAAAAKVRLAHVDQGYLNSCFLAAVMGALALRQPTRLERMVVDRRTHIEVRLPEGTVAVGKELPLERGRPIYAGSGGNAVLWPSYLEKAIASRHRDGYRWLDRGGDMRSMGGECTTAWCPAR